MVYKYILVSTLMQVENLIVLRKRHRKKRHRNKRHRKKRHRKKRHRKKRHR